MGFIILALFLYQIPMYSKNNDTLSSNSKKNISLEHAYVSVAYSKIFLPNDGSFDKNLGSSGNNFFGATFGPFVFISENFCISSDIGILLGNINGIFAWKLYFIPSLNLWIGHLNVGFGSGVSNMYLKNDNSKYGGLGSASELFANVSLTEKIQIGLKIGYDNYSQVKYNTLSFNLKYIIF